MTEQKFTGDFLESADLMQAGKVKVVIEAVIPPGTEKSADGRVIDKPILKFQGSGKRMVCGKTNIRNIKADYGGKVAEWVGKEITLQVRYLERAFGEQNVPTLRIIPTSPIPFASRKHMGKEQPWT